MRRGSRRLLLLFAALAACGGALAWWCLRDDLDGTSMRGLLRERIMATQAGDEDRRRVVDVHLGRIAQPDLFAALVPLTRDPDLDVRRLAVATIANNVLWPDDLPPTLLRQVDDTLSELVGDDDDLVRAWAVRGVVIRHLDDEREPPGVIEACERLLASPSAEARLQAAFGAFGLADRAQRLLPSMLATMAHESEESVLHLLAVALGRIGSADEAVVQRLLLLLEHASGDVRTAAVTSLHELAREADLATTTAPLAVLLEREGELRVRIATLGALAAVARDPARVERVLTRALADEQAAVADDAPTTDWIEAVGRLAARVPATAVADRALASATRGMRSDGLERGAFAGAGARIAAARGDDALLAEAVAVLDEVAQIELEEGLLGTVATEALVDVHTAHARASIDVASLRRSLTRCTSHGSRWLRLRARRLLAKLGN